MKIAVSVNEKNEIIPHLGRCKIFMIFTKENQKIEWIDTVKTNGEYSNHIIESIIGCDAVISGQIGMEMIKNLRKMKIRPYIERDTKDPIEAVKKIY